MGQAWRNDQRVKTLKIVIQVREKSNNFLVKSKKILLIVFSVANY